MSKQTITNLVLLLIVAVLATIIIKKPGIPEPVDRPAITDLSADEITHIRIEVTDQRPVELELLEGIWTMTQPYSHPANQLKLEPLLLLAATQSEERYHIDDDNVDLTKHGLTEPHLIITYNKEITVKFGRQETVRFGRLIQIGDYMHVTEDRFFPQLATSVTSWLDYKVLPGTPDMVKIVLPTVTVENVNGSWLVTPSLIESSPDQIQLLLENWFLTRGVELSEYTRVGNPARATIFLRGAEQPVVFDIIETPDNLYLGRADLGIKYKLSKERKHDMLDLPPFIYVDESKDIPPPEI